MNSDALRATLRSTIESIVALLVILQVFDLGVEAVGAIMLVVTNFLTLSMFIFKSNTPPALKR